MLVRILEEIVVFDHVGILQILRLGFLIERTLFRDHHVGVVYRIDIQTRNLGC